MKIKDLRDELNRIIDEKTVPEDTHVFFGNQKQMVDYITIDQSGRIILREDEL